MLKVLIVDDEKYIRQGLASIVSEVGKQFHVCAEAANGVEALALVEALSPEIVISDIKMPKMDGIELVNKINSDYPKIRKIILSGFDEFDFVRQSMINGATDYLLKPVDEEKVKELLLAIEIDIENDKQKDLDNINFQNKINESRALMKEKLLVDLIEKGGLSDEKENKSRLKDIKLSEEKGNYCIIIFSVDNYKFLHKNSPKEAESNLSKIKKTIQEYANDHYELTSFVYDNDIVMSVLPLKCDMAKTKATMSELLNRISKQIDMRCTISIGVVTKDVSHIKKSYESAKHRLNYRFYKNDCDIFIGEDSVLPFNPSGTSVRYEKFARKINDCLYTGKSEILRGVLNDLSTELKKLLIEPNEALNALAKIYLYLETETTTIAQLSKQIYDLDFSYINTLQLFDCLEQVLSFTLEFYIEISDKICRQDNNGSRKTIEIVKEYILHNYKEELTLEKLAKIVYINPTYLSEIFKCETSENFIDYITRVRIDKAKQLLHDMELKTYQVGQMVGYNDAPYFSRVFKKTVGVSPGDYRSIVG